jgi:replicative DNA helicase
LWLAENRATPGAIFRRRGLYRDKVAATEIQIPPQNLEAEESVLGAMMVSEGAIAPVILDVRLGDDDFYRDRHRTVYRAIKRLYEQGQPVDAISVTELLTQHGELADAGGKELVQQLPNAVPAPGNARHYAQIVKQNALLRRLLAASHTIQKSVHEREGEPTELVERAESLLFKVAHEERASDFRRVAEVLAEEIDRLEALAKGDREVTGTPSGFRDLDGVLGGFQPGNLIVIAARPALGKSALVCNIAENVASKHGTPVAFFSLEMSEAELAHRFIACRSRIPNDRLRKGKVASRDWPRVVRACNELESAPLWLDDSSDLSLLELRAKARRLAASEGGLGLVIVDYMQLMRPEDARVNRVEQVGQISRGLKILARELDVPVIGISQLSRAPEQRTGREKGRPLLSDLRESGCLTGESRVPLADGEHSVPIGQLAGQAGFHVLAVDAATGNLAPRPVINSFCTGRKPILSLRLGSGRRIRATGNHRFLSPEGWRRLDTLAEGERLATPGPGGRAGWDPIESIEPDGVEDVYDLTVEGLHNFVAEDIIVHNSIEQDSDVVVFIYRESKYNDEADPSEADLIVAKHRNGPTADVPVVFLEQYPRFVDKAHGAGERPVEQRPGEGPPLVDLAEDL